MHRESNRARTSLLALGLIALAAACASSRQRPENAVFCSKCETVWVEIPDSTDPYGFTMVDTEVMRCPDCENAVVHFFKTGELAHACSSCGSELVHCEGH